MGTGLGDWGFGFLFRAPDSPACCRCHVYTSPSHPHPSAPSRPRWLACGCKVDPAAAAPPASPPGTCGLPFVSLHGASEAVLSRCLSAAWCRGGGPPHLPRSTPEPRAARPQRAGQVDGGLCPGAGRGKVFHSHVTRSGATSLGSRNLGHLPPISETHPRPGPQTPTQSHSALPPRTPHRDRPKTKTGWGEVAWSPPNKGLRRLNFAGFPAPHLCAPPSGSRPPRPRPPRGQASTSQP